jgi:transposase, IS6 family
MIRSRSGLSAAAVGYRFPRAVIAVAVRWYLRYGLSYRDADELLTERGIEVDHVTIYRWVQTFTPKFIDAAPPARHSAGDRWFLDETYVKVAGRWTYLYRAVDQHEQGIDVLVSTRRDAAAARRFFTRVLRLGPRRHCCVAADRACRLRFDGRADHAPIRGTEQGRRTRHGRDPGRAGRW